MSQNLFLKSLIFCMLIALITACFKKKPEFDGVSCNSNCYILRGRVIDTPSNSGIQGVELRFYYRLGNALFSNSSRYLGKTSTNSNGDYFFSFDSKSFKNRGGYFRIQAFKNGYFHGILNQDDLAIFDLDSSNVDKPFLQNFSLFRKAKLEVRFVANTITNYEFLNFTYGFGSTGSGITFPGGKKIDTTITFQTAGDIATFLKWDAVGNGVNIVRKDTILVAGGGTLQYKIQL